MTTVIAPVATLQGPGRLLIDAADETVATLVLGHGAGGGPNATDLEFLARRMPEHGATVVRFEQPWRTAGRRVATPPAKLDEAWLAAVHWLGEESLVRGPPSAAVAVRVLGSPAGQRMWWGRRASSASRFRCTCQAGQRSPGSRSCFSRRRLGWSSKARRTRSVEQQRSRRPSTRPPASG